MAELEIFEKGHYFIQSQFTTTTNPSLYIQF